MNSKIKSFLEGLTSEGVSASRRLVLANVIQYIQRKRNAGKPVRLNFICTHNSRRSQFTQVWASVVASFYNIDVNSYSGGVEVTACNERTVSSLKRFGFIVSSVGIGNPIYTVKWDQETSGVELFSKLFDDSTNPYEHFAAVMTCSHADENCPFVTGCDARIPMRYEDPKAYDDTSQEEQMYDARSEQIAMEMKYIFSQIK